MYTGQRLMHPEAPNLDSNAFIVLKLYICFVFILAHFSRDDSHLILRSHDPNN